MSATATHHRPAERTISRRVALLTAMVAATTLVLAGCAVTVPQGIQPVKNFDVQRYAGTWYELARIDHIFERGLINTSAKYTLNADGTVTVVNSGFNPQKNEWKQAAGKASFIGDPSTAALKVSFFGPFYGGYNVVLLNEDYTTALVIGDSLDYFWLLSREKTIPDAQRKALLAQAERMGVNLSKVIDVPQR